MELQTQAFSRLGSYKEWRAEHDPKDFTFKVVKKIGNKDVILPTPILNLGTRESDMNRVSQKTLFRKPPIFATGQLVKVFVGEEDVTGVVTKFNRGTVTLQTWDDSTFSMNQAAGNSDKRRSGIRSIDFKPDEVDKKQVTFKDFDSILAIPKTNKTRRSLNKKFGFRGPLRF